MPSRFSTYVSMSVVRVALTAAALILLQASALSAQASGKEDEPDKVDTENLFGFTEGTDTGKKGVSTGTEVSAIVGFQNSLAGGFGADR